MLALLSILGILSGFLIVDAINDDSSDGDADPSDGGASPTDVPGDGSDEPVEYELAFIGTPESDTFVGSAANEEISGLDGNDNLSGEGGDDLISGGGGNDYIDGWTGNDVLLGGEGKDHLLGWDGNDTLTGGPGDDLLMGEAGNDVLNGWAGNDLLTGDDGNDELYGNEGDDVLFGGNGEDILKGGDGSDLLFGVTPYADDLSYGEAAQMLDGASVYDIPSIEFSYTDTDTGDVLDGGDDSDALFLGNGDSGTGGEGNDLFVVASWLNDGEEATIEDYSATDDVVAVTYPIGSAPPVLTLGTNGDDALLYADDKLVAVISGAAGAITAAEIQTLPFG